MRFGHNGQIYLLAVACITDSSSLNVDSHYWISIVQKFVPMNSRSAVGLFLLFLASGCAESPTPPVPTRNADSEKATNPPGQQAAVRERSVVKLTEAAVSKLKEFLVAEPTKHIRLSVKGEGSTGFRYDLRIDDWFDPSDFVDKSHGFTLVVDPKSAIYLEGATIDWQTSPDGQAGFKFDNPNAVEQ
jgi:iron-sulfur cluster assembly protein